MQLHLLGTAFALISSLFANCAINNGICRISRTPRHTSHHMSPIHEFTHTHTTTLSKEGSWIITHTQSA